MWLFICFFILYQLTPGCEGKEEGHWNCVRFENHGQKVHHKRK